MAYIITIAAIQVATSKWPKAAKLKDNFPEPLVPPGFDDPDALLEGTELDAAEAPIPAVPVAAT